MDTQVIVVGAGPTGLMLASELDLAGVRVTVMERLAARTGQSKALNLQPRTAEVLDLRGWFEPISSRAVTNLPAGHFAGLPLDYQALDTRFPYQVGIPQARVAEFLEDRLLDRGVPVLRDRELVGLRQDTDGVTAIVRSVDGHQSVRADYLVGADGGRSAVRTLAGIDFPGRDGRVSLVVADVVLTGEHLPTGWQLPTFDPDADRGPFLLPLGDGVFRLLFGGPAQQGLDRDAPVTEAEITAALRPGTRLHEVRWASRFTDASRQARRYRDGRVLLAGDAAHIHIPAGGQGLNLGMQDAFNLGWKLAAQVRGWAPAGLLDTYHDERHPVGARVLANTRAQGVLASPDPDVRALRGILADLLREPAANRQIAGMISGLDIRYDMPCAPRHPLLGTALSDITLHSGRGALVEFGQRSGLGAALCGWSDRVEHLVEPARQDAGAVLVRPDGYVCWAGSSDDELRSALGRWFGKATGEIASRSNS